MVLDDVVTDSVVVVVATTPVLDEQAVMTKPSATKLATVVRMEADDRSGPANTGPINQVESCLEH